MCISGPARSLLAIALVIVCMYRYIVCMTNNHDPAFTFPVLIAMHKADHFPYQAAMLGPQELPVQVVERVQGPLDRYCLMSRQHPSSSAYSTNIS